MRGMIEVTVVRGGEESLSEVTLRRRGRVSIIPSEFSIRRNVRGYMLPTWWSYMLHEYGTYSGPFRLPAVGCMAVMEAPIDWGSVEVLPAQSERCEATAAPPYERQVVRAIPQCTAHGHGTLLLSQLLQQEPRPPGPHPPSSSSSDSDKGGPPGTGLWYEGEWWWYDDVDGNGGSGDGAAGGAVGGGGATGGGGGVYEEGE